MTLNNLTKFIFPCTLVLLLAAAAAATLRAAPTLSGTTTTPASQWQFALLKTPVDTPSSELGKQVMKMGREGWDLVSVESITKDGTTTHMAYYFKRPL